MMIDNVISLKQVNKYYNNYNALKNVSFNVNKGHLHCFFGPNGSGKTTTINIILGLSKPSLGSVELLGVDPYLDNNDSLNLRQKIGTMLEYEGLFLNLTGIENLVYWAELYGLNKSKAYEKAVDVIKKLELLKLAEIKVSEYSHNMKKRLCFARSIINDPEILVLDEPTWGVEEESQILIRNLLKSLIEKGKTIFLSSYDFKLVEKIPSVLSIIYQGKIMFSGTLNEFFHTFGHKVVYCNMDSPENAKTKASRIEKFCTNLKIEGTTLSFIPGKHYKPNLEDEKIVSSWTQYDFKEAYMNLISYNGNYDDK